jgi:hypothetical protein
MKGKGALEGDEGKGAAAGTERTQKKCICNDLQFEVVAHSLECNSRLVQDLDFLLIFAPPLHPR